MSAACPPHPKCIAHKDIKNGLEVRRLAGRHLGQRKPVTRATLIRWRDRDGFPKPFRTCAGGVELWDARQVRAWLRDNRPGE